MFGIKKNKTDGQELDENWERNTVRKLALASLEEQRRTKRWGIFFKFLAFAYLFVLLLMMNPDWSATKKDGDKKHTALVDVSGIISNDADASADNIVTALREAFEDDNTAGVILRINSPGGSPVQSAYINDEIHRLREKYEDIPLYAVISDLCASGGYYIAAGADKIYANKSSLVGSIGVIMNGFGFVDSMEKLGVQRRLHTAGEHKGFLDPFSPENPAEVAHVEKVLEQLHQQFIDVVKKGRGERLKDNDKVFSGLIWSGEEALAMGLVDDFASSSYVAREVIKAEDIVDFTVSKTYLEKLTERLGASVATHLSSQFGLSGALR
ncbi:S49 family peptidase [Candidatus Venteria ishoeyi]|uniref:S49 family peptidase n=1 Tax=Candidatus Venteria ishoeyi TaxID=1899563 RepID=UPI0025A5D4E3|nr:S49 family peptidase [Candidatus Venteria ishoeyi]MDM8546674.1 S49 family peptidase [Candidatus Venteria ishoeyi]